MTSCMQCSRLSTTIMKLTMTRSCMCGLLIVHYTRWREASVGRLENRRTYDTSWNRLTYSTVGASRKSSRNTRDTSVRWALWLQFPLFVHKWVHINMICVMWSLRDMSWGFGSCEPHMKALMNGTFSYADWKWQNVKFRSTWLGVVMYFSSESVNIYLGRDSHGV